MKMRDKNMNKLINQINAIDNMADLNVVIDVIRSKQKSLRASVAATAKTQFSVGDTVDIATRKKGVLKGVITKINRTRAICDINGDSFNVPFSIMKVAS
tara:strand:- start:731 stop:1027 length:297 start_codon:yes stop_codon:yes gene_type:complete